MSLENLKYRRPKDLEEDLLLVIGVHYANLDEFEHGSLVR